MAAPLVLLILSMISVVIALAVPGWSDLLMAAVPSAIASLFLVALAAFRRPKTSGRAPANWIVVDGSNVMYWKDGTPKIDAVRDVVRHLSSLGFQTGVMFDANAGYLLFDKYQHDRAFSKLLNLPEDRIMVVPKGTPADPFILTAARDLGARIVTNDRFRDWGQDHPEIRKQGHLIQGDYRSGTLWLDVEQPATAPQGG